MRAITAYQTSDNKLFTDEQKAASHQEDIIGELLDDLVENDDRGNLTRADRHNILIKMLKNPKFKEKINKLHYHLNFEGSEE